jgi:hypothetical protein
MWIDIHSDSLGEIAKAFAKLGKKNETEAGVKDSEEKDGEDEDKNEDSADKEGKEDKNEDSKDGEDKDKNEDSADEDKKDKGEKDGCNKDSAFMTKDDMLTALKAELAPMVADAVKECLGLKDGKPSVEGSELDSMEKTVVRDYTSFLEK